MRFNHFCRILVIFLCLGAISGIVFYCHMSFIPEVQGETVQTSVTVVANVCGNHAVETGETCDDGNVISGDGCSSTCQIEVTEVTPKEPGRQAPSSPEEVVYKTRVIFEGEAYPNALITILKDGQFLTTVKADSKADFRIEIKDLTSGNYTFGLWAEDKSGLRSPTFTITFFVAPGVTTTVSGILLPPTISLSKTEIVKGEGLSISGSTAPSARVEVSIYSESTKKEIFNDSAIADSGGAWYYLFNTKNLKEGVYSVRAKSITDEGLISAFSKVLSFEVFLVIPPKPPVPPEKPVPPVPPVAGVCPGADLNKDGRVNFIDFSILLYWWGRSNDCADQSGDGVVDLIDFSIMMYWWTG